MDGGARPRRADRHRVIAELNVDWIAEQDREGFGWSATVSPMMLTGTGCVVVPRAKVSVPLRAASSPTAVAVPATVA